MRAEAALWLLRQGGRKLERYVEEFLELANQLSWHDAALAPSEAHRVVSAHTTPGAPICCANGSDRLPRSKRTPLVQGSICFLSPETPAAARSKPLKPQKSHGLHAVVNIGTNQGARQDFCSDSQEGKIGQKPCNTPLFQTQLKIRVVGNSYCKSVYGSSFTDNMMCAGQAEGGKGTCQGAGGGPMVVEDPQWIQSGTMIFGVECAASKYPSGFTRVSQYQDWISSAPQATTIFQQFPATVVSHFVSERPEHIPIVDLSPVLLPLRTVIAYSVSPASFQQQNCDRRPDQTQLPPFVSRLQHPLRRKYAEASVIAERSSAHCNMAEALWADLPLLLPPLSEPSVTPVPMSSPEWTSVPMSCPERALVFTYCLEEAPVPEFNPKKDSCSVIWQTLCSTSAFQLSGGLTTGQPVSITVTARGSLVSASSLRVQDSALTHRPSSSTMVPSFLLSTIYRQSTSSNALPCPSSSALVWCQPSCTSGLHSSGCDLSLRPSVSARLLNSSSSTLVLFPGSTPPHQSPGPFAPPRLYGFSTSPWLIGSPSPPRTPPPPAPPPSVTPLELLAFPPPWLLPLSALPWVVFMAVAWVLLGSSCSKSLLSPPGLPWSLLSSPWLLPPSGPPWSLLSSPWFLPLSSPPRTLFVILLPSLLQSFHLYLPMLFMA
ncbi:Transmembrane protease serine 9 [Labeo rohita]|uniref:Transmembrane protease serine 9 n=1 Tax=Labeo rohita TaxID=84645 RepID=A0ABQ8LAS2_LABRO|nr:Transmembrane protease serine 9 [Labeo rohita]